MTEPKEIKVSKKRLYTVIGAGKQLIDSMDQDSLTKHQKKLIDEFQKNADIISERRDLQESMQMAYNLFLENRNKHGIDAPITTQSYCLYKKYKSELKKFVESIENEERLEELYLQNLLKKF